jgi:gluconokinase
MVNHPHILALDIGSSSVRAMLYDSGARSVPELSSQIKYQFRTSSDGGSEMDPDALFEYCIAAMDETNKRLNQPIEALAGDCFTLSILGVDADGRAVTPIYTYADSRGAREVDELRAKLDERKTHQRIGTMFHTSYLPARLLWLAHERAESFQRAKYWMSFGEYMYLKLFGVRKVSYSIASWTGLLNRSTLAWDQELLHRLPIENDQLSEISDTALASSELKDEFKSRWSKFENAIWLPFIGDGAAANIGSGCADSSRVALTIGTSSAMRIVREQGMGSIELPFGLWSYRVARELELIGGALNEGGNVFEWTTRLLKFKTENDLENELTQLRPDAHGLTILPFFAGERAPNWNADARGAILGLTLNTRPIEILRAGMEAVAYRLGLVYEMLEGVTAGAAPEIIASGGALMSSPVWVQMIADVLNLKVSASAELEATSRGCALFGLKALGAIEMYADIPAKLGHTYTPDSTRHEIYAQAIVRQKKWYNLLMEGKG